MCIYTVLLFIAAYLVSLAWYIHRQGERRKLPWQQVAAKHNMVFTPGQFPGNKGYISGEYRGYVVTVETVNEMTRVRIGVPNNVEADESCNEITPEYVMSMLNLTKDGIKIRSAGRIVLDESHQMIYDARHFEVILNRLCDVADTYRPILAAGGEAVPALRKMMLEHYMGPGKQAVELLRGIGERTAARFKHRAHNLICPHCLTRFAGNRVTIPGESDVIVYGCRLCWQSHDYFEGRVVMVLAQQMAEKQLEAKGTFRRNWLVQRQLCDFHSVEILQATDEDVERFAMQVGNDTDPVRQASYQKMTCTLYPNVDLSENTLRILARTFGTLTSGQDVEYG